MARETLRLIPLYLAVAIASGFVDLRSRSHADQVITAYIPGVIDGTYGAPFVYRVLAPYSVHGLSTLTGFSLSSMSHATRLAWFLLAYIVTHCYLRLWFGRSIAVAGTLLVAALLPMTFTNSWAHPDHIPELALFTLGCYAVAARRDLLFGITLVLATLNRETAVFLVALHAVVGPYDFKRLRLTALFGAIWASLFVGVRLWRGFEAFELWQFKRNLGFLTLLPEAYDPYYRTYGYFWLIVFGPLTYFALRHVSTKPEFARRALLVVPMFVVVAFTMSSIIETRIFTPVFPLVLPAALFSLVGPEQCDRTTTT